MKVDETFNHISEKTKKLEEAFEFLKTKLDERDPLLDQILSHIPDGIIFISKAGKIGFFNKFSEKLTGYQREEILDKSYWEHFPDTLFGFSVKKALLEKEKKKAIFLNLNNGKKEHHLEVSFSEVPDSGIVIVLRDASEMRKMKQTLDRNDRLKEIGEMAARLAHEIRNPLGGIEGFAGLLARDLKDSPKLSSMVNSIIEGTRLLNRLVTSVLHYARPLEVHFARWDLNAIITDVIGFVIVEEKKGRKCCFEPQDQSCYALVDKELFEMALLNLLRNAFEATPPDGIVTINVIKEKKWISISISDQGEGITKENQEKIFTPFFTTKAQGTGLGLSEAHKVITAHDGKIDVETEEKKGSVFTIKIPSIDEY